MTLLPRLVSCASVGSWLPHPKTRKGTRVIMSWGSGVHSAQAWAPAPHLPRLGCVPAPPLLTVWLGPLKEESGGQDLEMDSPKAVSAGHLGGPISPKGQGLPNISTRLGVGPPVRAMHSWQWGPSPLTYQAAETCSPLAGSPHPRPASLACGPASLIGGSRTSVWSRQWYLGTRGGLAAGLPKAKPGFGVSWVWESEGVPHAPPGPAEPRV